MMEAKDLIGYIRSLGIEVHTSTKARGHQGFFLKNRIDISKNIPDKRLIPTLLHEFAHYVHSKLEPDMNKTGGTLKVLFKSDNPELLEQLIKITNFADENSLCTKLYEHKKQVKKNINALVSIIKKDYPEFMRSKKFKPFEKYIKKSKAKYLLKYDRVKVMEKGHFITRTKIYSVDNIETDFPDMPASFAAYIRLKSLMRKQTRITSRINRLKKYYQKPCELFARLIEGLYSDKHTVQRIAPEVCEIFYELLNQGYYPCLKELFLKFYSD